MLYINEYPILSFIFFSVTAIAHWHLCIYIAKRKSLLLRHTYYLYGVPFTIVMYFFAKAACYPDGSYDNTFLMIFLALSCSLGPLGVAFSFFESEKRERTNNFTGHIE